LLLLAAMSAFCSPVKTSLELMDQLMEMMSTPWFTAHVIA